MGKEREERRRRREKVCLLTKKENGGGSGDMNRYDEVWGVQRQREYWERQLS